MPRERTIIDTETGDEGKKGVKYMNKWVIIWSEGRIMKKGGELGK